MAVGIAIPSYEKHFGIKGPYFGDLVFDHLRERHPGKFEKIQIRVKGAADTSEETLTEAHVRDRIVYVIHPCYLDAARHVKVAEEVSDDLLRSDVRRVVLVDPYNRYFSYDKRKRKQSLNARITADNYASAGISRIFTVDPHSDMLVLAFGHNCPLEPLPMDGELASYFRDNHDLTNMTVCSPDIGGYNRAELFADLLDLPLVGLRKRRSQEVSDTTESLGIVGDLKNIEGRDILFRDDVIRSGDSIEKATAILRKHGAKKIYAAITHLELCGKARDRIMKNKITVIGTNTMPREFSDKERKYFDVLDISPIVAEVIYRRSEGMPIGQFFEKKMRNNRDKK